MRRWDGFEATGAEGNHCRFGSQPFDVSERPYFFPLVIVNFMRVGQGKEGGKRDKKEKKEKGAPLLPRLVVWEADSGFGAGGTFLAPVLAPGVFGTHLPGSRLEAAFSKFPP